MDAIKEITEKVSAELAEINSRWAEIQGVFEAKELDDTVLMTIGMKIRAAADKVHAIATLAKWTGGYQRGTDMATDSLMAEIEALPGRLREALEAETAKLY